MSYDAVGFQSKIVWNCVKLCLYLSLDRPAFPIQRRDNHPQ